MKTDGSKGGNPGDGESGTDKKPEQHFVVLSLKSSAHLPPAVCHDEGDGHRGPFAAVGRRLLAVPQDDDLRRHDDHDALALALGPVC